MKFVVLPSALAAAYSAVKSVVSSKALLPIRENVLFRPSEDGSSFTLTGSDDDTTITVSMPIEEGSDLFPFLLSGTYLGELIGSLGDWPVDVEIASNGQLSISDMMGSFQSVCGLNVAEYPTFPQREEICNFTVNAGVLIRGMADASLYTEPDKKDAIRPIMTNVCLEAYDDGSVIVVASDSKQLFSNRYDCIDSVSESCSILVKPRVIKSVAAMFACGTDDILHISYTGKSVSFSQGASTLVTTVMEGKFPRWKAVLPKNNDRMAVVDIELLRAAINRVRHSADLTQGIRLTFDGQCQLAVEAQNIDFSLSAKVTVETDSQTNMPHGAAYGVSYTRLLTILSSFKGQKNVTFQCGEPARAVLLRENPVGEMTALFMPMQILW